VEAAQTFSASPMERSLAGAGAGAMSLGAGIVWYLDPARAGFLPACPLYTVTGFACPGCGLTRGFHALLHGDILGALGYNALIPLFIVIFGVFFLALTSVALRGRPLMSWNISLPVVWGMFVLLLLFGILRNLPFYPFSVLFP
jgi:hypothetical protein